MTIHKEGRGLLIVLLILFNGLNVIVYNLDYPDPVRLSVLSASIVIYLAVLQFFRSPRIVPIKNGKHILAPADGKVVVIENVDEEEYFKDTRTQISIFMSPLNVHVNRSPVSGLVSYFKYHPGKYLVAWHPKSSTENERTTTVVKLQNDLEILFRQIAGAVARRIKFYIKEGDQLEQGGEFGFIKFGSRVDVLLPTDASVKVSIGDKTKGGRTVLAELV